MLSTNDVPQTIAFQKAVSFKCFSCLNTGERCEKYSRCEDICDQNKVCVRITSTEKVCAREGQGRKSTLKRCQIKFLEPWYFVYNVLYYIHVLIYWVFKQFFRTAAGPVVGVVSFSKWNFAAFVLLDTS